MDSRLDLQFILEETLGTKNVYFQPPATVKMSYPCIVYKRSSGETNFASNKPYLHMIEYQVIVIGKDPDSNVLWKMAMLPMCTFVRHYVSDNLNHDVYRLFY